jgi:hypothetical protein
MGWCAWLLASWALNLAIDPPLMPEFVTGDRGYEFAQRITPAIRGMLVSMIVALVLLWPAVRLSQRFVGTRQLLADLLSLTLINQVVLWPMRALIGWPIARTVLIDLHLIVWPGFAALLIRLGTRSESALSRGLAMIGCVALLLGGFAAAWITGDAAWSRWSPVEALWLLCDNPPAMDPGEAARRLATVGVVAGVAWAALLVFGGSRTSATIGDNMES